jgi:DHA1 family multidrug resistance protein-like MFS transporter
MKLLSDIRTILTSKGNCWKRNLLIIVFAQFIAMAGMSACVPFLPLYVRELGMTDMNQVKFWSGIVFSGPYIMAIFAVPFWGTLGDKYGRKLMVIRAIFGLTIAMFLMGFAQNVVQLFLLRIFQGFASGFVAATLSFISAETPGDRTGYAIGMLQSSQFAGTILGPLLGGLMSDFAGIRPVFYLVAALCLISGTLILLFVKENNFVKQENYTFSTLSNLKYLLSVVEIRLILILIVLAQAGIHFTTSVFPYFVEQLNTPSKFLSSITGFLLAIVGFFSIIFAPRWGKQNDKKNYRKIIPLTASIVGIATVAQLLVSEWYYLIPFRILIGIFIAGILPTFYSALSKKSQQKTIGSNMSVASSATFLGAFISFFTCAWVSSYFGIPTVFIVSGLILIFIPVILLLTPKLN